MVMIQTVTTLALVRWLDKHAERLVALDFFVHFLRQGKK